MRAPGIQWRWAAGALLLLAGLGLLWAGGSAEQHLRAGLSTRLRSGSVASATGPSSAGRGADASARTPAHAALSIQGTVWSFLDQPVAGASLVALPHSPGDTFGERLCQPGGGAPRGAYWGCAVDELQVEQLVDTARASPPQPVRATSDAQGHFELPGLQEGPYEVWVDSPQGVAVQRVEAGAPALRLTLEEGMVLGGIVKDDTGEPLADISVAALSRGQVRLLETPTGPDGRFSFGRVPTQDYLLLASHPGLLPDASPDMKDLGDLVSLWLRAPRVVQGRVMRQGQGVPEVPVRLRARSTSSDTLGPVGFEAGSRSTRTDALGRFTFDGVRPGAYLLEAPSGSGWVSTGVRVEQGPGPQDVLLELSACARLEGVVTGEAGGPLAGARVHFLTASPPDSLEDSHGAARFEAQAEADARGHYRFECVAPGPFRLEASAPGALAGGPEPSPPLSPGESRRLDWRLKAASPLEGHVVDEEGRGVPGVGLYLEALEPLEGTRAHRGTSDAQGHFSFDGLAAGPYRLELEAPEGFESSMEELRLPRVEARLVLRRAEARPGLILGTVRDGQGRPMADVHVYAWRDEAEHEEGARASVRTNEAGHFRLKGLAVGLWHVEAAHPGLHLPPQPEARARVAVQGPAPLPLQLRLDEGLQVTGEVLAAHGAPVVDAPVLVAWRDSGESWREVGMAFTDARGRFTLRHLPAGQVRLEVRPPQEEPRLRTAWRTVRAGDSGVRLVLEAMRRVSGRVVREDGLPVGEFFVNGTHVSDPRGAFSLPVEPDRPYHLLFTASGLAPALRRVRLEVDADSVLPDVVLRPARPVRGRVLDALTGAPVEAARVALFELDPLLEEVLAHDNDSWVAWTEADGAFLLPGVAPGTTLTVAAPGYTDATATLPEGTREVVLRLQPLPPGPGQGAP